MTTTRERPWSHRPPISDFAPGTWPDGLPRPGSSETALYAAVLASFVLTEARKRSATLNGGLEALAQETGIAKGTLRGVIEGNRWPRLDVMARLETALGTQATGRYLVLERLRSVPGDRRVGDSAVQT